MSDAPEPNPPSVDGRCDRCGWRGRVYQVATAAIAAPCASGCNGAGSPATRADTARVPEPITDETPTAPIRKGERFGEVVAGYHISGEKRLNGKTFKRDIFVLSRIDPPKKGTNPPIDIRAIMGRVRSLIAEAKAAGATRLTIRGWDVGNENVLGISRLAKSLGGTATVTSTTSIEISVPVR